MERQDKILLGLLGVLLLIAGVIGAILLWRRHEACKVEIIDGVLYGPSTGSVHMVLLMRDASMQTHERRVHLSLDQPVFSGVLDVAGKYYQANGAVRPMVTSQDTYMVDMHLRPYKSQAEGLKWKAPVPLRTRREMGSLDDLTFFIRLDPPPRE